MAVELGSLPTLLVAVVLVVLAVSQSVTFFIFHSSKTFHSMAIVGRVMNQKSVFRSGVNSMAAVACYTIVVARE